ncbi:MAG: cobalamin biosynthesis protein [Johnsonella sp.]|nr:cobalamin biosynthesis protein [Johnsonella sp.]
MQTAIFGFTRKASDLSRRLLGLAELGKVRNYVYRKFIADSVEEAACIPIEKEELKDIVSKEFSSSDLLIFIGASGIAVRMIAPHIRDKFKDPAVICMDEGGKYVIPLLSGHAGGANRLAGKLSEAIDALPIITTATDLRGLFAVDSWAMENKLLLSDKELAKQISADLLQGRGICFASDYAIRGGLPAYLIDTGSDPDKGLASDQGSAFEESIASAKLSSCGIWISNRLLSSESRKRIGMGERSVLRLIPRNICIGIGCKRGTDCKKMREAFFGLMEKHNLDPFAVSHIASIDIKSDEEAICRLAGELGAKAVFFKREELLLAEGEFHDSEFVKSRVGVGNVCERASSLIYSERLFSKQIIGGMTFAATFDHALEYSFREKEGKNMRGGKR